MRNRLDLDGDKKINTNRTVTVISGYTVYLGRDGKVGIYTKTIATSMI